MEKKIAPGDYLSIKVESTDEKNFFTAAGSGTLSVSSTDELTLTKSAFLVDTLGEVNLPVIGKINVSGLTLEACSEKLQMIVKSYLSNPTVDVRYAFKTYTILGEVNSPGKYNFASKKFNIFEAIGEAGDLTFYGKRNNVYVIRDYNGQTRKIKVDLTDDDILLSDNYYIRDKDIILVNSRNYVRWEVITTPIGTIVSSISLVVLILNLTETYQFK
ncbi:MAG: polysaccharide export protein [Bacteroidales bacterium]|nr:polysaccharide export protein [Bacteroidales bacterium]